MPTRFISALLVLAVALLALPREAAAAPDFGRCCSRMAEHQVCPGCPVAPSDRHGCCAAAQTILLFPFTATLFAFSREPSRHPVAQVLFTTRHERPPTPPPKFS